MFRVDFVLIVIEQICNTLNFPLLQDINAYNSDKAIDKLPFPIIADLKRELSVQLGMLDPDEIGKDGMPLTARVVNIYAFPL